MRYRTMIGVLLATALGMAACSSETPTSGGDGDGGGGNGSGSTGFEEVMEQIEGLSGQERTDTLVELATEEGQLNLYTSMTSDLADEVASAFDDAYGIEPSVYRADSETVLTRLVEEADAGFPGSDIAETNGTELAALNQEGVLVDLETETTDGLVEDTVYEGWIADRFNKFVISWNTDAVPAAAAPSSWEDLADPKWDGQLALEPSDVDWFKTLWEFWVDEGKSEEEIEGIFRDMADGALFTKGHTVMGELLSAGEFQVAASNYSYIVQNAKEDGAPVEWQPPTEPIISRPNGIGLVRGAQHPATAILFMEWMLTDGQEILVDFNLDPARQDLATAPNTDEVFVDLDSFLAEQEEWTSRYEELATLGETVEE
jgi:iron(III) transport system substrate-binding protein